RYLSDQYTVISRLFIQLIFAFPGKDFIFSYILTYCLQKVDPELLTSLPPALFLGFLESNDSSFLEKIIFAKRTQTWLEGLF
ncbi:MAG: hypothetical protein ABSF48_00435, partial [Thermodesulfobacteriota bacterium]